MRLRILALRVALGLLALVPLCPFTVSLRAQDLRPLAGRINVAEVDQVLRAGDELERARKWGEALAYYEQALRAHPDLPDLEQRLSGARLHYEIISRYADRSFLSCLQQLREAEALDLYGEVLLNVESHYVETPDWRRFVEQGISATETALGETAFLQRYTLQVTPEQSQQLVSHLRQSMAGRPIRSRHDARDCAALIARTCQRELGLAPQVVILEFACAVATSLDEYSSFLTGDQMDEVLSQIEGNFVGLGVELKADIDALLIVNVIPGGPADAAGIRGGERIVQVDGRSLREVSTETAADMLKGVEGSSVQVAVVSSTGETRQLQLQRRRVEVPSVDRASLLDRQHGVAYMRLTSFQKTTVRDVDAALWKLHREGMQCLILDLRGNPGGLLTASVDVVDRFVAQGAIVSTRGRSPGEDYDYQAQLVGTWRVPLVVLIDENSASASEIFAGAIRDHHRGTLVGARSYGKGSVQGIFPLGTTHAGLRLTTARFYSPGGQPISRRGVQPDVLVHVAAKPDSSGATVNLNRSDVVLDAAVGIARQNVAER
jgi:carboxyl-terminal processing protease